VALATVVAHAWLHEAQFCVFVAVSTQVPPQRTGVAAGQPELHAYVDPDPAHIGAVDGHVVPQPPQFDGESMLVSQPCCTLPVQCA
jgi:hypothetical protein